MSKITKKSEINVQSCRIVREGLTWCLLEIGQLFLQTSRQMTLFTSYSSHPIIPSDKRDHERRGIRRRKSVTFYKKRVMSIDVRDKQMCWKDQYDMLCASSRIITIELATTCCGIRRDLSCFKNFFPTRHTLSDMFQWQIIKNGIRSTLTSPYKKPWRFTDYIIKHKLRKITSCEEPIIIC